MTFQSLEIDMAGICSFHHECTRCVGESQKCCSTYEVTISRREMENIIGCIPLAARFCARLKSHREYVNVFEKISEDLYAIDANDEGTCVFAYFEEDAIACSLHAAAEKCGLAFQKIKPTSCLLWPLAIFEGKPGVLSIHDDIFEFPCNVPNAKGVFSLCPSIAENIEYVFGPEFLNTLQEAADKGTRWTKIRLQGIALERASLAFGGKR